MWLVQRNQAVSASAIWDFILSLSCDPLPFLRTALSAFLLLALAALGSGSPPLTAGDHLSTQGVHWGSAAALKAGGEGKHGLQPTQSWSTLTLAFFSVTFFALRHERSGVLSWVWAHRSPARPSLVLRSP